LPAPAPDTPPLADPEAPPVTEPPEPLRAPPPERPPLGLELPFDPSPSSLQPEVTPNASTLHKAAVSTRVERGNIVMEYTVEQWLHGDDSV
jgi:hypothetical protein